MGFLKTQVFFLLALSLLMGCREPEVRWPVSTQGGSFLKISAARNKQLLADEETLLAEIRSKDSARTYFESAFGSLYYYEVQLPDGGYTPQAGDQVSLTYSLTTWNNDTLYRDSEIGILHYAVDREALFPGLRQAIKLLQEGETAIFLFPSSLGYGYLGDKNRIGSNIPLKCKITLLQIEKTSEKNFNP